MESVKKFLRENVNDANLDQRIWDIEDIETLLDQYSDQRVKEELDEIRDILDSENSGLSIEQRVRDVQGVIRELKQK